jgi:hypothetical protein
MLQEPAGSSRRTLPGLLVGATLRSRLRRHPAYFTAAGTAHFRASGVGQCEHLNARTSKPQLPMASFRERARAQDSSFASSRLEAFATLRAPLLPPKKLSEKAEATTKYGSPGRVGRKTCECMSSSTGLLPWRALPRMRRTSPPVSIAIARPCLVVPFSRWKSDGDIRSELYSP